MAVTFSRAYLLSFHIDPESHSVYNIIYVNPVLLNDLFSLRTTFPENRLTGVIVGVHTLDTV